MRTHEEETAVPFAPGKNSHSGNPDQLDRAGQTILQLLNKAAGVAEENSCAQPRIGLRSSKPRSQLIKNRRSAPSNGCTGSTLR